MKLEVVSLMPWIIVLMGLLLFDLSSLGLSRSEIEVITWALTVGVTFAGLVKKSCYLLTSVSSLLVICKSYFIVLTIQDPTLSFLVGMGIYLTAFIAAVWGIVRFVCPEEIPL